MAVSPERFEMLVALVEWLKDRELPAYEPVSEAEKLERIAPDSSFDEACTQQVVASVRVPKLAPSTNFDDTPVPSSHDYW
jgi:hypothetical protein